METVESDGVGLDLFIDRRPFRIDFYNSLFGLPLFSILTALTQTLKQRTPYDRQDNKNNNFFFFFFTKMTYTKYLNLNSNPLHTKF